MRLTEEQTNAIREVFRNCFPESSLFLFGSRTDDSKKGGDIDLLILSDEKQPYSAKIQFEIELQKRIGDRKIDILNYSRNDNSPFLKLIMLEAIEL